MNFLSLVNLWLNNDCKIKTKVLVVKHKIFREVNKTHLQEFAIFYLANIVFCQLPKQNIK